MIREIDMVREIKKKMFIIQKRTPFPPDKRKDISSAERKEWIFDNMRLDGSSITTSDVDEVLRGGGLMKGRLTDHVLMSKVDNTRELLYQLDAEGYDFDLNMIKRLRSTLGMEDLTFRNNTPALLEFSLMPPLPRDIARLVDEYIRFFHRRIDYEYTFIKAAELHNKFIEIYPYKTSNLILARSIMQFFFIRNGFPMVSLSMDQEAYFDIIKHFMRNDDSKEFASILAKAMYAKLERIDRMTS